MNKKSIVVIFAVLFSLNAIFIEHLLGQESLAKQTINAISTPPKNSSLITLELIGKSVFPNKKPWTTDSYRIQTMTGISFDRASDITRDVFEKTNKFIKDVDYNLRFEKNIKSTADFFMKGAGVFIPSIPGKLGMIATSELLDRKFDEYLTLQKYEAQKSAVLIVSAFLDQMREEGIIHKSPSELTESEKNDLFSQVSNSIYGSRVLSKVGEDVFPVMVKFLFEDAYRTIVEVDAAARKRDVALSLQIEGLEKRLTADELRIVEKYEEVTGNSQDLSERAGNLEGEIENLAGLSKSFIEFQNETNKRLNGLTRASQRMYEGLQKLDSRVTENEKRISNLEKNSEQAQVLIKENQENIRFMQMYLYSNMSSRNQLEALDQGWFPKEMEKSLREKAELLKAREDFDQAMHDVVDIVSMGTFLAAKWGANPKVLEKIDFTINAIETVGDIANDILSGFWNPINIFKSIFTLGFGSAASRRHKQVMKALKAIAEGQQKIMEGIQATLEGLQTINENQKIIIGNQKRIMENLTVISEQITAFAEYTAKRFDEVNRKLADINEKLEYLHDDVLYNRELLNSFLRNDPNQCKVFLEGMTKFSSYKDGFLNDYEDIKRHFEFFKDSAQRCFTSLGGLLAPGMINPVFFVRTAQTRSSENIIYYYKWYSSMLEVFKKVRDLQGLDHGLMIALLSKPSLSTDEMEFKYHLLLRDAVYKNEVSIESIQPGGQKLEEIADGDLDEILNPMVVREVAEWVLKLHHYYQLSPNIGTGDRIYTPEEYMRLDQVNFRGRDILNSMIKIINIAIVQQALLSGDYLIEELVGVNKHYPLVRLDQCVDPGVLETIKNDYAKEEFKKFFSSKIGSVNPMSRNPRMQKVYRWKQEFFDKRENNPLPFMEIEQEDFCNIFKSRQFSDNFSNYIISNKYVNGLVFTQEILGLIDDKFKDNPYCPRPFARTSDDKDDKQVKGRSVVHSANEKDEFYYDLYFNCGSTRVFVPSYERLGAPLYNPIIYELNYLKSKIIETLSEYEITDLMNSDLETGKVMSFYLLM